MAATRQDIKEWFLEGKEKGATHMLVVCDTYDYDDYPSYVLPNEDVQTRIEYYKKASMQRIMELYKLSMNMDEQLNQHRVWNI